MVTGKSESAYIHEVADIDDGHSVRVTTRCKARPHRCSAAFASASTFRSSERRFCPNCLTEWPADIVKLMCA